MFGGVSNWLYEQFSTSENKHWYTTEINDHNDLFSTIGTHKDNLAYSMRHPILTGAMLFICNLFAQAEFRIEDREGKIILDEAASRVMRLLDKPNYYQTRIDFLEALQWIKIARGSVAVYLKRTPGFKEFDSMYILDPHRIRYPDNFKTPMAFSPTDRRIGRQTVRYRQNEDPAQDINIKIEDLLFLYDLPNIASPSNRFITASRLDGLHQTLDNTVDSLIAKNIILRSNGKEMLSSDGDNGFPMDGDDQETAKKIFNLGYGLSPTRDRAFITKANVKWQSMHIALRDLGLDESTKVDGNIVYTALHIPKDILSLEAKKTTYNNFRESMTSFIQNDMTSMVKDFTLKFTVNLFPPDRVLIGTFDHLPVMAYLRKEYMETVKLQGEALTLLRNAGVPDEAALELCQMDKTLKLEDVKQVENNNSSNSNQKGVEEYIKRIVEEATIN